MLEAILWILSTGAPWRDLPTWFGPWQTVYGRFRAWRTDGVLDRALRRLQRRVRRRLRVRRRGETWCVDTTIVRASRAAGGARETRDPSEPADHALGRSRGGFGTKVSLVCDEYGTPLAADVGPGQEHDLTRLSSTLDAALRLGRPARIVADRAYSVARIRTWLARRRIRAVIPTRSDQVREEAFDWRAYRRRNVVERLVGWLKESRRMATRYEKLAAVYLAVVKVAMLRRLIRTAFPNTS